jgi:hypothetical protein
MGAGLIQETKWDGKAVQEYKAPTRVEFGVYCSVMECKVV